MAYNLLLKFNINATICTTVFAVKHFHKYVHKEHDRAIIQYRPDKDIDKFGEKYKITQKFGMF